MKKFIKKCAVALITIASAIVMMGCNPPGVEKHTHTFSENWSFDETYHWHAATCEHTEEVSDKDEHTFGEWTITTQPTEEAEGLKERSCSVCNFKATETVAKLDHTHKFATTYSNNVTHHWYVATCEHTDQVKDRAEHTFGEWTITTQPTEEAEGLKEHSCSVCNFKATEIVAKLDHTHKFATTYSNNVTHHWYAATCEHTDQVKDKAEHTFGEWTITTQPTEEAEGLKERSCSVCNFKATEIVAKLAHTHAKGNFHSAIASTCTAKGKVEYYDCVKESCEIKLDKDGNPLSSIETPLNPSNHTGTTSWTKTDTTHKETYDCCKAVKTAEANHTWNAGVVTKAPTLTAEGEKKYTCTVCSATKTETMEKKIYSWYESPIDAETGLAATKNSTHVLFGVFPKTIKASSVTIKESDKTTMGANIYYKGSDGEYYAKVTANPNGSRLTFSDSTKCSTGSVYYFKVEPIMWKVLTTNYNNTNKALLHAENVLTGNVLYYGYNTARVGDIYLRTVGTDKDIFPNNYKYSQIRAYLNGLDYYYDQDRTTTIKKTDYTGKGFLQTAFTSTAQTKIANTTVDNSENSTIDENNSVEKATGYTCANTTDKVFLLSLKEVTTASYGFDPYGNRTYENSRTRLVTDYAMANHTKGNSGEAGWWWLRSPYSNFGADMVYSVSDLGIGGIQTNASYYDPGVVPALTISLQ